MPNLGLVEILVIFVALVAMFGSKRLPEMARSFGNGIRELKEAVSLDGEKAQKELATVADKVDVESVVAGAAKAVVKSRLPGGRFLKL